MGSGVSNAREAGAFDEVDKCNEGLIDESSESFAITDFKFRLQNEMELQMLRTFANSCSCMYLLDIWELVKDYEAIEISNEFYRRISILLQPHVDSFPMSSEFLKLCSERTKGHINPRTFVLLYHIHQLCFHHIFVKIYQPLMETALFKAKFSQPDLQNGKQISHGSFNYLTVIAQGGFGVVLKCRKVSTGQDFAMKIQPKSILLRHFHRDKTRVTSELEASVVFSHPYIASVVYAFQTETMVMLVSPISACGDLRRSLNICPNKRMSLDRVVFYAAEITSALMYLHRHDIMYRDLKPANVLLHADGHIMLADFGSVAGFEFKSH